MEYQKTIDLLDNKLNQPTKLGTKNRVEKNVVNHEERTTKII